MREFVYIAHEVPPDGDITLDDLPGAGRLDLLARAVTAALLLSHDVRSDTRVHLVVDGALTVRFDGHDLQGLNPDERSTAARVRSALASHEEAVGRVPVAVSPGVSLVRQGLAATLADTTGTTVLLQADGEPAPEVAVPAEPTFVLSDHRPVAGDERELLSDRADLTVSLGPEPLHADHATTLAHNWLDTDGYRAY